MPHSFGIRARTRDKFSKEFRQKGLRPCTPLLTPLKKGDIVDIICDSAQQKGMPHSFYHGRTGRIFAVFPRSVGVDVNKVVGNRQIRKRLLLRIEHIRPSRVQAKFKEFVQKKDKERHELRLAGVSKAERVRRTKRQPVTGRSGFCLQGKSKRVEFLAPIDRHVVY
ncbi:ribosomal protein RPL21 [Cardiosporidium cionae]|uniref:Ribosomal protein RPL21 n=1 Tax=Cardiosporidium cionae TaxID=476202 RepID=A0ABQ7J7K6_9APIC|nr:ribosomal protein RPL21 [Cardiosporidium cionae]|eukprot:KAF8819972.1 ribosomal protein RPL21 [Cardiosporidium cionae]